jgi:hypothetical protein
MGETAAMISLAPMEGLAGAILLPVAIVMAATQCLRLPVVVRLALFFLAAGLAFIPVNGLAVAEYIKAFGELSFTTLLLLFTAGLSGLADRNFYKHHDFALLMTLVLALGVVLYPFSLGLTAFDSYALGYGSKLFCSFLLLVALTAWYFNVYLVVIILLLDISAFLLGFYESLNLWDYLIDPLLTVFAFFWFLIDILKRVIFKRPVVSKTK